MNAFMIDSKLVAPGEGLCVPSSYCIDVCTCPSLMIFECSLIILYSHLQLHLQGWLCCGVCCLDDVAGILHRLLVCARAM